MQRDCFHVCNARGDACLRGAYLRINKRLPHEASEKCGRAGNRSEKHQLERDAKPGIEGDIPAGMITVLKDYKMICIPIPGGATGCILSVRNIGTACRSVSDQSIRLRAAARYELTGCHRLPRRCRRDSL